MDALEAPNAFKIPIILVLSSTSIIRQVIRLQYGNDGHNDQYQHNGGILQV